MTNRTRAEPGDAALDSRAVRRSFDAASAAYDAAAVLQKEVRTRLLSRLEFVKLEPAVVLDYVDRVVDGAGLPVSIFQYPIASGLGFSTPVLVEVARRPGVLAIKEGSGDVRVYEENWRAVKQAAPEVAILASNFDWFLAQAAIGADGILSGLASLTPDLLVELWRAAQAGDLRAMRRADARLHPVVRAIYGARPLMDMHTRIKVGLRHLGVIDGALPRPPLRPVAEATERVVIDTVDRAGLAAALAA